MIKKSEVFLKIIENFFGIGAWKKISVELGKTLYFFNTNIIEAKLRVTD